MAGDRSPSLQCTTTEEVQGAGLERGWPVSSTKPQGSDSQVKEHAPFNSGFSVCTYMRITKCRRSGLLI